MAAWGVLGGGITMLSNYSALKFHQGQLEQAEVHHLRGSLQDAKGQSLPAPDQERLRQTVERDQRYVARSRIGLYLGGLLLLGGVAATGAVTFLVLRRRRASAEPNAAADGGA